MNPAQRGRWTDHAEMELCHLRGRVNSNGNFSVEIFYPVGCDSADDHSAYVEVLVEAMDRAEDGVDFDLDAGKNPSRILGELTEEAEAVQEEELAARRREEMARGGR